ncbi:rho guanine nucleotide exchange factor 1b isoform X2 [Erpetoichthys calabaricus]|uniref:Rho guanine nucleotide exchange factor (GEF) 1 n=1 Tax=Erpetoichthys calabaricus TaxID=27687 RepID=A0A8C4TDM9_ERPCA|nr:rho guanine nucleotide exchange factor 1b isoform X2 [Erpetoichthys calabaricus]
MANEDFHDGHIARGNPYKNIIGAEDEDFENEIDPSVDDLCSHFQSIDLLKEKPAHLLIFLQHVFLQFDCAPLLCFLHAELFKNLNAKEVRKQFVEFYHTFLEKGAVLKVQIPSSVSFELDRTRPDLIPEEMQRRFIRDIQNVQAIELVRQLEDFRQKRMMGMTPGERELAELEELQAADRATQDVKERAIAEQLLDKLSEMHPTVYNDDEKSTAMFNAIITYMKHLGVKAKSSDNKKSRFPFIKKIPGIKRPDEPPKSTKRFPHIFLPEPPRWMGSGSDKDKINSERKNSTGSSVRGIESVTKGIRSGPIGGTQDTTEGPSIGSNQGVTGGNITQGDGAQDFLRTDTLPTSDLSETDPAITNEAPPEEVPVEAEKHGTRIGRSESLCAPERRRSQKGSTKGKQPRSRSDVDLQAATKATSLQSSTTAQPDTHSLEPGSGSGGGTGENQQSFLSGQPEENEPRVSELEVDPPNWREQADSEQLLRLKKTEIKRQEVINELFVTEHAHVRMLNVLYTVFFLPMEKEKILSSEELAAMFPGLEDIIEVHNSFYESLKKLRQDNHYIVKNIGDALLNRFSGTEGEWFQKLSSRFCSHQSYALDEIKKLQKKDSRFTMFIQEAESKPQCRRLQLKDIIPVVMQRLTKYPLLLENIAKSTEEAEEKSKIQQAAECCRKILNHVNQSVRVMENFLRLNDYQRRLDLSSLKQSTDTLLSEFKNLDLSTKQMIHEGPLLWRVNKEKTIEVHVLLLTDILVLLQKQDDKMVLKCQMKSSAGVSDRKEVLSPVIKLNSVFSREVATDRKAFYVIFTWESGAQIFELVAQTVSERKNWCELIKMAVEDLKKSELAAATDQRRTVGLTPVVGVLPTSPTYSTHPPLSPSENGNSVKDYLETLHQTDKEKDLVTNHMIADFLAANGIDPYSLNQIVEENVASAALEEVFFLKRMLVGNIHLSENVESSAENAKTHSELEVKECEMADKRPDEPSENGKGEEKNNEDNKSHYEREGILENKETSEVFSTPVILSLEQKQEVAHRMDILEQQLRRLKNIEEEFRKLQEGLAKVALSPQNFT